MSIPFLLGCLWVVAAALTALLPMRGQMVPGLALLIAAPVLLVWIGRAHGPWWVLVGSLAFVSMFRRPLTYLGRKALGLPVENPRGLHR